MLALIVAWAALAGSITARTLSAAGLSRQTADWQADLINQLVDAGLLTTAESIARRHFEAAEPQSDAAARWAIRWSVVRSAALSGEAELDEARIADARKPIDTLLIPYPNHPRGLWLRTQRAMVDLAVVRQASIALAIDPELAATRDAGLQAATACVKELDSIADDLKALPTATDADWKSLKQTVGQQRVEALLLRGRLFSPGSDNAIASATAAEGAAERVLGELLVGTEAYRRMTYLRAEALIEMGNPAAALSGLETLQRRDGGALASRGLALQIRALLSQRDTVSAAKQIAAYFGEDPTTAPRSTELDLVRLEWLLLQAEQATEETRDAALKAVADWLQQIELRGGRYAKRRGEALTLRRVRLPSQGADTRLLAAEAARQLRSGQARQAAELLTQAAATDNDASMALRYAVQAAAVFQKIGRAAQAAEVLTETALRHAREPNAAATHMQAAWVLVEALKQTGDADTSALESVLEATVVTWPESESAATAAGWLEPIWRAAGKHRQIAELILETTRPMTVAAVRRAAAAWQDELRVHGGDGQRLAAAIGVLRDTVGDDAETQREAKRQQLELLLRFGDLDSLAAVDAASWSMVEDPVLRSWWQVRHERRTAAAANLASSIELAERDALRGNQFHTDLVGRLFRDGESSSADRPRLGAIIVELLDRLTADPSKTSEAAAEWRPRALIWSSRWKEAATLLEQSIAENPQNAALIVEAAEFLGESADPAAWQAAIDWWGKLASGVAIGSPTWHEAKLATIALHLSLGDRDRAMKLARYVLLTQPPDDDAVRDRYDALLDQASQLR